ncbi:hypothetical protein [Actinacidiphila glaucinigra]|uniref:hypothetical protein n=1 Tax=Actinacidiphila glaucinigra TaxID=235986 RepID=UPI002E301EB1|nr:hypothetical protein [Actinacidiphila glaucinigra]
MASAVEATVTPAFARANGTGPESTGRTAEDASPTPPPHRAKRTNAAGAERAESAVRGRRAGAGGADLSAVTVSMVTVSMPAHCPPPLTGR